jgi:hypothetical protein
MTGRPLIAPRTMASLATLVARTHTDRCEVSVPVGGRGPDGGTLTGRQTTIVADCRVDPGGTRATESPFGPSVQGASDASIGLPLGVELDRDAEITVLTGPGAGTRYGVVAVVGRRENTFAVETLAAVRRTS